MQGYHRPVSPINGPGLFNDQQEFNSHAGYSYSGPNAAWAYKSIDTTGMHVIQASA